MRFPSQEALRLGLWQEALAVVWEGCTVGRVGFHVVRDPNRALSLTVPLTRACQGETSLPLLVLLN